MRVTLKLPSGCFAAANTVNAAPGVMALRSPTSNRTIGTLGPTTIFCSPSLYLTVMIGASTLLTVAPTVPLVMVLVGPWVHGWKPSPVPRMDSAKMCTSIAFCVPSGCGMAPLPMKSPGLMSAKDALTTATTMTLSASSSLSSAPLSDFAMTVWPSMFSIVPRSRTVCGCWASAADAPINAAQIAVGVSMRIDAVKIRAKALATIILNWDISLFPSRLGSKAPGYNPTNASLFRRFRLRKEEVGLEQRPQLCGHFGFLAEPQHEAAHRLMHQHAEPVGGAQFAPPRRPQQRRYERHIDKLGDEGVTGQPPNVESELRLPGHAERRRVDDKRRIVERGIAFVPADRMDAGAEALMQGLGAALGPVGDNDTVDAAVEQRVNHRARRAAGAEHDGFPLPVIPTGRASVEIVQKTFDVAIGRTQHVVVEPQRIGGADGTRAIVRLRGGERRFLMRHGDIGADIAARGERFNKCAELIGRHRLAAVFAGDAVGFQPIIMNKRRARMLDRPADDTGRSRRRGHASSATVLRSTPISGQSTSMVSPGFSHTGGSAFAVVFTGVPVQMTSPALSVMKLVV